MSDWKWTGPAEPMLVLSGALRERGHHVGLVCPESPAGSNRNLWQEACLRGFDPIASVPSLRSALRPGDGGRVRVLERWLQTDVLGGPWDIVHTWHSRDHVLAARALARARRAPRGGLTPARLVRSLSHADPIAPWPWNRWLFGPGCDGLVCVSDRAARQHQSLRGGRLTASATGAIDFGALTRQRSRGAIRDELGIPDEAPVIGVVARMQWHRRFDLLLSALVPVVREIPDVRLVVVGRGTHAEHVVREPAEALGISDHVVLAGYRTDDYADVLAAMDLFTYLVPGSDGTCRALLQAAALGIPLVGSRRGAIPEIISNGQTGILVEEDAGALATAWCSLLADAPRRRALGEAARLDASRFRPDRLAAWMEAFYGEVAAST